MILANHWKDQNNVSKRHKTASPASNDQEAKKPASGFEVLKLQGLKILSRTAGLGDWVEPRAVFLIFVQTCRYSLLNGPGLQDVADMNFHCGVWVFGVGICWDHGMLFLWVNSVNASGFNTSSSGMIIKPYPIERFVPSDFFCQELVALAKHRGVKANGKKASTDLALGDSVLVGPGEEIYIKMSQCRALPSLKCDRNDGILLRVMQ